MANVPQKKSSKKVGRNGANRPAPAHKRYNAERRWIKHKINRIVRYMKRHPNWKLPVELDSEIKTGVLVKLKR